MLIASDSDLHTLLSSPACPMSLVTRVDAHHADPSSPLEPFVALSFESFEEDDETGDVPSVLDRTLLRHSGRRIVTIHSIRDVDDVSSVSSSIERVRCRLVRLAGHRAQFEASWYPIVIFRRPIRTGDIKALRELQKKSLPEGDKFRIGRIPTVYVMDRDLSMTTGRELLSSQWVWPRYVVPLLLRLQAVVSDADEQKDPWDVCAWRFLEIGPSIPIDEFEEFFQAVLGDWRDRRREGETIPWPALHWDIPAEQERLIKEKLDCGSPELGEFGTRRPSKSIRTEIEASLPSHQEQSAKRSAAGASWRAAVRALRDGHFGTRSDGTRGGGTGESGVWRRIREVPGMLQQVAARAREREPLHARIRDQVTKWRLHCERSTRWHADRVRTLIRASILDEMERHFVSRWGRFLFAAIVMLMIQYVFMAVLEPLVPGVPWWLHGGVLGGALGAFAAAWWSHRSEKAAGSSELARLESRVRPLVDPGLPKDTLDLMIEGLKVGGEQATSFSREVVVGLADRAEKTISRSDGSLVGGTVNRSPFPELDADPTIGGRENRMAEDAFHVRTYGTSDAMARKDRMEGWAESRSDASSGQPARESQLDRFRRRFDAGWERASRDLDPDAVGHYPFIELRDRWRMLIEDTRRQMYHSLLAWCFARDSDLTRDELARALNDKFLAPRRRTTDPPGRSCQVVSLSEDDNIAPRMLALGESRFLEVLRGQLKGTGAEDGFNESFPPSMWATPDWRLHSRIILLEEVRIPDDHGGDVDG